MIGLTLGRYLSSRFFRMILAVFATIFSLVFVIDFVELLRRTGNIAGVTPTYVAFLSLLRTPSVSEQVLPFCVLFGSMAVFLNLTRKLELLVARASGISVWQFLAPPVLIAALIGVVSVTVLNPLSANMKQRADVIETALFGKDGAGGGVEPEIWIRQTGVDGEAILRATGSADHDNLLFGVTAYVYDRSGRFAERVKADRAILGNDGVWRLENALITQPGEEPHPSPTYLLATTTRPGEVEEGWMSAEAVPFWELPALRDETESAGLDASSSRVWRTAAAGGAGK